MLDNHEEGPPCARDADMLERMHFELKGIIRRPMAMPLAAPSYAADLPRITAETWIRRRIDSMPCGQELGVAQTLHGA